MGIKVRVLFSVIGIAMVVAILSRWRVFDDREIGAGPWILACCLGAAVAGVNGGNRYTMGRVLMVTTAYALAFSLVAYIKAQ